MLLYMEHTNNTETTPRPATYARSGTHEFRKGGLLQMAVALVQAAAYGAYSAARDALCKR